MPKDITIVLKGDYTDRDVKRAIRDLSSLQKSGERTGISMKKLGIGLAAGAAAAGAFAIKVGVDAVRAAMEEEQSISRLSVTLRNLGLASADTGIETMIDNMQYLTGIADQNLRPAYDRLIRSTGSVAEANKALGIASDIAVAKQRDVVDVANILGKAYDGNTMALSRMGVGIDRAILKSGDMAQITRELQRLFGGQAAAAAGTMAGKIQILGIAIDELQESFGKGLVAGLVGDDTSSLSQMTDELRKAQQQAEDLGKTIMVFAKGALSAFDWVRQAVGAMVVQFYDAGEGLYRFLVDTQDRLGAISDEEADVIRKQLDFSYSARHAAAATEIFGIKAVGASGTVSDLGSAAAGAATGTGDLADGADAAASNVDRLTTSAFRATSKVDQLKSALDKLNGGRRSAARTRIQMRTMRREGPAQSGSSGTGKDRRQWSTPDDKRTFALDYMDEAEQLAMLYPQQATQILTNARRYLTPIVGSGFVNRNMRLPGPLTSTAQQVAGYRYGAMAGVPGGSVNNYYISGQWVVNSAADAVKVSQQALRLAKTSGSRYAGMAASGRGWGEPGYGTNGGW